MSEDTFDKDEHTIPEKEEHSDYKPVDQKDEAVKHQLSGMSLSLIHISEPTRRTPISYAVFC